VFVPSGLQKEAPLVVALHGAGGSENMFFQAYGAGAIVRHARDLGWVLVAPRGGFSGADPEAVVAAIAARAPIDRKRVFLVGHSLGARLAAEAAPALRGVAGIALLGGGGAIRGDWSRIPAFVGIGAADPGLPGARAAVEALRRAKCARLEAKEYPDVEHLAIVAVALPDVFRFFLGPK
jgi:predicted esterase